MVEPGDVREQDGAHGLHHDDRTDAKPLTPPPAKRCLIVAGPTASGKSALALSLAERLHGTVINADAMQCYRELRILTARPTPADEARAPHRLYGTRAAAEPGTAASWRAEALAAIDDAHRAGRLPILCGGTFLYMAALTDGLAEIPDPGSEARTDARALLAAIGPEALHVRLTALDPDTAATLRPTDGQRLARAWEVRTGTGRGLLAWQRDRGLAAADARFAAILLRPPRLALRAAIERRLDAMLTTGILDEVASLRALDLDPALPLMRAHGVAEFAAHLAGTLTLDQARARTLAATVRYTRRQETWLRHHDLAPPQRSLRIDTETSLLEQQMEIAIRLSGIFQSDET